MPKKFYVSWDNLQREARRLARRQLPVSQWKGIIAVSRGGLVPAALMARELGIRNVETLCISSYDHDSQRELVVVKAATTAGDGEGWLVVEAEQDPTIAPSYEYAQKGFNTLSGLVAGLS